MKAYTSRLHRQAHIYGAYVRDALVSVLAPMFSKNARTEEVAYPTKNYLEQKEDKEDHAKHISKVSVVGSTTDKKEAIGRQAILDCY